MNRKKKVTKMKLLIIAIVVVLGLQVLIFVITRKKIKKERANSIIEKYNIISSGDAWRLINNLEIPEEDRQKMEEIYKGDEKGG